MKEDVPAFTNSHQYDTLRADMLSANLFLKMMQDKSPKDMVEKTSELAASMELDDIRKNRKFAEDFADYILYTVESLGDTKDRNEDLVERYLAKLVYMWWQTSDEEQKATLESLEKLNPQFHQAFSSFLQKS